MKQKNKHGPKKPEVIKQEKERFLAALSSKNIFGLIYRACKQTGMAMNTFYRWADDDPEFAAAVKSIRRQRKEFAEHHLYKLIEEGDSSSVRFVNSCLRPEEYTQKTIIAGDPETPLEIKLPDGLVEEALRKIRGGMS